jgi:adenosylmethionine-8-amino-7-oxononanoate aminotransferase
LNGRPVVLRPPALPARSGRALVKADEEKDCQGVIVMKRHGVKRAAAQQGKAPGRKLAAGGTAARRGKSPARDGRTSTRRKRGPGKTVLADAAIAKAAARAEASMRAELRNKTLLADRMAEDAVAEAEEIGMLLGEGEEEEEEESEASEEDQYFLKAPAQGPPRPRIRPAPEITGADAAEAAPGEAAHLFPRNLKTEYPVAVRGEGIWIHDRSGKAYLDGCGGAVVCSIGHGVREVADVISKQARRLAFAHSSQFITREAMELSARIAALAPGDMKRTGRVYLVSGGSEAVETAIKMARQYHLERGRGSKFKIISRWQSYHGSSLGALAATGNVARREPYAPLLPATPHIAPCYCYRCPYDLTFPSCDIACVDDLERAIRQEGPETVAAFIAEPVVGATLGAVPAVDGYWQRARALCDKYDVLLIADEVMTGVGRTGRNFAVDHFKVVPDLIAAGKGLSAGYTPLGAVIARGPVAEAIRAGRGYFEHGFTYSANPLSAAIGNAVLAYIEEHGLIARAARMGRVLGERLQSLRRHPIVGDVRGMGMMWGVEIVKSRATREPFPAAAKVSRRLYEDCLEEGLLIYPGSGSREGQDGDHFIVAPAFTITKAEIDDLVARLDRGLARTRRALR